MSLLTGYLGDLTRLFQTMEIRNAAATNREA